MGGAVIQIHMLEQRLVADPGRVVVRPFHLAWKATDGTRSRSQRLVDAVVELSEAEVAEELAEVLVDFEARHWQTRRVFETRFDQVAREIDLDPAAFSEPRRQLVGAYFCHEYSYAAAAIMNPSVTEHYDQTGMPAGCTRIILSLRTVGEGHISSIAFREGIVSEEGWMMLAPQPPFATAATRIADPEGAAPGTVAAERHADSTLSGTVIFPMTAAQANGLEDLRLTKCQHTDEGCEWIGTYTAYSGSKIHSELLRTQDFRTFQFQPMQGDAAVNKGMALFPRQVDGRYRMIGRQDGQNLYLLDSDDVGTWNGGKLLLEPEFPWELVQIGNCGAPIELDEGWLLLTHGVGAMRKYAIGAVLLDKDDPSKVLGRSPEPLLSAKAFDREGYVPNVVYTCGAMCVGRRIFLPHGLADSSVAFAFVDIPDLLAELR